MDVNKDGEVTIVDLLYFYTYLPLNCQFGQEIADKLEVFFNMFVLSRKSRPRAMNIDIFKLLFEKMPCIITEFAEKMFLRVRDEGKHSITTISNFEFRIGIT